MMECHLAEQEGINLHLAAKVEAILGGEDGKVRAIKADGVEYEVEQVILATGYRPNSALAQEAGLELEANGGIKVNRFMQTSDPDVFAGGDCVSLTNIITHQPMYIPAGSLANRMGRVIATNVCGGQATFPGAVGSFCIKLFGLSLARTGLNQAQAEQEGLNCVAPLVVQADRAHFHPDNKLMYLKLVVEEGTRRVLGLTALGENGDAVVGRVNAVAGLLAQARCWRT